MIDPDLIAAVLEQIEKPEEKDSDNSKDKNTEDNSN